jgi:ketosteroid isomerase-like protein
MKSRSIQAIMYSFLLASIWLYTNTKAQAQQAEVKATVDQLFTGMRTGDSTLVRKAFTADATLQSVSITPTGQMKAGKASIDSFIKAVGTPHTEAWDERIYDLKIQVDGPMATVWAPYKFYIGEKFSHCGVNAFTLLKTEAGWKIAAITDTRRKEDCL